MEILKVRLKTVSPVNIGCDQVYEPTSFVIDENRDSLIEFDTSSFIDLLTHDERNRFVDLSMRGTDASILDIYKFIRRKRKNIHGKSVDISKDFINHYLDVVERGSIKYNKFLIDKTVYNPNTRLPYIPGSSIKGSIRTAYLNNLAEKKRVFGYIGSYRGNKKNAAKDMEKDLLEGGFHSDPFRMVKVSDFLPVEEVKTKIVYAVNKKKPTGCVRNEDIYTIMEVVAKETVFEGTINIEEDPIRIKDKEPIKTPIKAFEILMSLRDFYNPIFDKESAVLKNMGADIPVTGNLYPPNFLVRIGRHSGAESMTISENRHIKIKKGKKDFYFANEATTVWLASETRNPYAATKLLPFGWAVMEVDL